MLNVKASLKSLGLQKSQANTAKSVLVTIVHLCWTDFNTCVPGIWQL